MTTALHPAIGLTALLVLLGLVLWLLDRRHKAPGANPPDEAPAQPDTPAPEQCCGQHAVCQKDSLLGGVLLPADLYFDDEELDRYARTDPAQYPPEATEQFRDVLLTLPPDEVAPWARALQQRQIQLPPDVREELLLLVSENRTL